MTMEQVEGKASCSASSPVSGQASPGRRLIVGGTGLVAIGVLIASAIAPDPRG